VGGAAVDFGSRSSQGAAFHAEGQAVVYSQLGSQADVAEGVAVARQLVVGRAHSHGSEAGHGEWGQSLGRDLQEEMSAGAVEEDAIARSGRLGQEVRLDLDADEAERQEGEAYSDVWPGGLERFVLGAERVVELVPVGWHERAGEEA
jgi:hypothetical protein